MNELMTDTLQAEYEKLVSHLGPDASDDAITQALIRQSDWSESGARTIITLAHTYGTAVLRNALALADAMGVEDGDSGL